MYKNMTAKEHQLTITVPSDRVFNILQLTDLHLGFGPLSKKADRQVLTAIDYLIEQSSPDLIVLTGDLIYPFLPKTGTLNNGKQMMKLLKFLDGFAIPYAIIFGNHDIEMGSKNSREQLADIIMQGEYALFDKGPDDIFGVGNYLVNLRDNTGSLLTTLLMLDSNMYGDGWFFSGFDCIHQDQIDWALASLDALRNENNALKAHAFYHMPLADFKDAYRKLKLGSEEVSYHFGNIAENNDYFGISKYPCDFFSRAVKQGIIKTMFCGHDHLNTLSLTYKGITMTYGMSLDFHAYSGIKKRYTQRGGTLLSLSPQGNFTIKPIPLTDVVSTFVRGKK